MKNMEKTNTFTAIFKKSMQNMIIIAALAVLVLIFWVLNPNFLGKYNIVSMAQSLAPYAIMGLGVTFVIATGGIDLSIGTTCIAAAVIAGKLYMNGMPLGYTIPVMIAIGGLVGFVNGILVAKLKIPAFIATGALPSITAEYVKKDNKGIKKTVDFFRSEFNNIWCMYKILNIYYTCYNFARTKLGYKLTSTTECRNYIINIKAFFVS